MLLTSASCPLCRRPGPAPCLACRAGLPPAPPGAGAVLSYQGTGRQLLLVLKYRGGRSLLPWLGVALARLVEPGSVAVVTWAPTHAERRRRRGYDQAELLARATAGVLGLPCRRLLRRLDRAGPQTGRPRRERLHGPEFAARRPVRGGVLVVDDVVTTGATLRAAVGALEAAGARPVRAVAVAVTPR